MNERVIIQHYRRLDGFLGSDSFPMGMVRRMGLSHLVNPRGGMTVALLVDDEGLILEFANAWCSDKDNYNKQIGRDIALGRLTKRLLG